MQNIQVLIKQEILIVSVDGKEYSFEVPKISSHLSNASQAELMDFKLSPSGYGIQWKGIDEYTSIPALLNEPLAGYKKRT